MLKTEAVAWDFQHNLSGIERICLITIELIQQKFKEIRNNSTLHFIVFSMRLSQVNHDIIKLQFYVFV